MGVDIELSEKTLENIKKDIIASCEALNDNIHEDLLDIAQQNKAHGYGIVVAEIMSKYILIPKG